LTFNHPQEIKYDDANDFFIYRVNFLEQDVAPYLSLAVYHRYELVYFQLDLSYRRTSATFRALNLIDLDNITETEYTKKTHSIDLPFVAGVRYDRFKFGVGPVFSVIVGENPIFSDTSFFEERRDRIEKGFGFHIGAIFERLHLDVNYQYRFNQVGDYLYWRNVHKGFSQPIQYLDIALGVFIGYGS